MEMLEEGHVQKFGKPSPTTIKEGTVAGPAILVTGHDMLDLHDLLLQTAGKGVNVYTHGEMLPAHMYPELRKFPHLVGHFGGAWQKQKTEFAQFSGAILATTNCIMEPRQAYADRVFSTRVTAFPGGRPLKTNDFTPVIEKARSCPPLKDNIVRESQIGFHKTAILELAGTIVQAVKDGKISRFFLIGGCDGAEPGRNYFSDYAQATPRDSFILTLGCGKYRIRDYDYGTLLGLPRLLDMGQCNDAYGAIQVAVALSKAFDCSVNDLPLTLVVSWFEQKAVAVLLTLLSLGVKGITIGPNAPGFVTPNVFKLLQEKFDLRLTGKSAKEDLNRALAA
jgi:hydroxylamine reductase